MAEAGIAGEKTNADDESSLSGNGPTQIPLTPRFDAALQLASELHRNQYRKGTSTPYVSHPISTCAIALEYGADEDQAIAALLHDAVEDQGGAPTLERIRGQFGERVADIVSGCTDDVERQKTGTPEERAADSAHRKREYVARLAKEPTETRLVSAADKLHNARTVLADLHEVGDAVWDRFKLGREGTLTYYRDLLTAFRSAGDGPIVRELDRTVTAMEALAETPGR